MKKPQIKILDWYIIKKFIGTYLFTVLITILIFVVFDLSEKIEKFVTNSAPLNEIIFQYYAGFICWLINSFSPLLIFISVIFFTSKLSQHSEMVAMLAGGISFKRILKPYMIAAGIIAALSLFLGLYVIPSANQHRLDFENQYVKVQRTASGQRNIHYQLSQGEFVFVEQFSQWSNTAYRFTLESVKENRLVSKISAESAAWDSTFNGWKLNTYFKRDIYGGSEVLDTGYQLDTVISLTIEDFYRRKNVVESLPERELNDLIALQKMRGDEMVKYALIEKNTRIATPFSAFILTIMAVSLCSRKKRGGLGLNIGVGLALSFSYILFQRFSQMFVMTDTLPPVVALWLPNILYAGIAFVIYKLAPK